MLMYSTNFRTYYVKSVGNLFLLQFERGKQMTYKLKLLRRWVYNMHG